MVDLTKTAKSMSMDMLTWKGKDSTSNYVLLGKEVLDSPSNEPLYWLSKHTETTKIGWREYIHIYVCILRIHTHNLYMIVAKIIKEKKLVTWEGVGQWEVFMGGQVKKTGWRKVM